MAGSFVVEFELEPAVVVGLVAEPVDCGVVGKSERERAGIECAYLVEGGVEGKPASLLEVARQNPVAEKGSEYMMKIHIEKINFQIERNILVL